MGLLFFVVWLGLFIWRKNIRKEMIIMSSIFAFAGPMADILYTQDWWKPLTLTGTRIGVESFLVGFMIGGISSVIYEEIFKKRLKIRKFSKIKKERANLRFLFILIISALLFFGSFYLLQFSSLTATIISLFIPTIFIWIKRKDLILDSLVTGLLLVVVASLVYTILEFLTPGWIQSFWYFKDIPSVVLFNLPLNDIIWYFLAGLFIGPLYEYWQEGRLINKK